MCRISAPSLYSGSRLNTSVRILVAGSAPLTAVDDHGFVHGLLYQDADRHQQGPHRATAEHPSRVLRYQAVQAVEGYRCRTVREADGGPGEHPAVDGGTPNPPLHQCYPDDWDDQRIERRQQDGGRQFPYALDVLDRAALLPRLPGQLRRQTKRSLNFSDVASSEP